MEGHSLCQFSKALKSIFFIDYRSPKSPNNSNKPQKTNTIDEKVITKWPKSKVYTISISAMLYPLTHTGYFTVFICRNLLMILIVYYA